MVSLLFYLISSVQTIDQLLGDAVSLTASVNTIFGAKYAGESSGIIYNDVMVGTLFKKCFSFSYMYLSILFNRMISLHLE